MMDEIKPVAWAFAQDWTKFQADRRECRLLPNFYYGEDMSLSSGFAALYDQQAIDTLREQVNRLFLSGREWATRFGEQEARAERAEAEVERLKEVCDKWSERELLFGAHEDLQARAERAEAEAEALRKDAEGRWDEWLSHALSKWPEAEAALIATRVALGPTAPITQADIDFAKREAL